MNPTHEVIEKLERAIDGVCITPLSDVGYDADGSCLLCHGDTNIHIMRDALALLQPVATPDEGVSYGNARCQCGHLSNAHACDREQGDASCARCGCDGFIWDRTPIPPPVATPAPAGEARLRELVKEAYAEGFADAREAATSLSTDDEDIEPHWRASVARSMAHALLTAAPVPQGHRPGCPLTVKNAASYSVTCGHCGAYTAAPVPQENRLRLMVEAEIEQQERYAASTKPHAGMTTRGEHQHTASVLRSILNLHDFTAPVQAEKEETRQGWQDISTAPKDGSNLLLSDGLSVSHGGWLSEVDQGAEYEGQGVVSAGWWSVEGIESPTHWMPLPAAPTPERQEP